MKKISRTTSTFDAMLLMYLITKCEVQKISKMDTSRQKLDFSPCFLFTKMNSRAINDRCECKERQYDTDTKMPPLKCESITDFNVGVTLGTGSFGRVRVSCDTL